MFRNFGIENEDIYFIFTLERENRTLIFERLSLNGELKRERAYIFDFAPDLDLININPNIQGEQQSQTP